MDQEWPAKRARRDLRRRCGTSGHYARSGICWADAGALAIGFIAGLVCYLDGDESEGRSSAMMMLWTLLAFMARAEPSARCLTGVFAQQVINPIFGAGKPVGGLDGHWGQIGNQVVGVLVAWGFALVGTIMLLKITDMITGLRVPKSTKLRAWTLLSTARKRITWSPKRSWRESARQGAGRKHP